MKTIIIKFGGSSLADPGKIRRAAAMVLAGRRRGLAPVAVVSAPPDVQRARVLALYALAIPAGSAIGYLLGGTLGQHFGWRNALHSGRAGNADGHGGAVP